MLRRTALFAAALLSLALAAAGCAPIHVGSHLDRNANFVQYRTFAWGPADALPTGDPRLDNNPFFRDYLLGAIERNLAARGLTLAGDGEPADLLIHYHAAVTQRFDVSASNQTSSGGYTEPQVIDYDESTIVVDLLDSQSKRLVWRGWAQEDIQSVVDDQARLKQHIDDSIVRMMKLLPM